jgi:hypothetical protein
MSAPIPEENLQQIRAALFAGRKIEAIKLHREATGMGLKQSKDFVDALDQQLRKTNPGDFSTAPAGKGCAGVVILGLGLLSLLGCTLVSFRA